MLIDDPSAGRDPAVVPAVSRAALPSLTACLLLLLACGSPSAAAEPPSPPPVGGRPPSPVTVLDLAGRTTRGALVGAGLPGAVRIDQGDATITIPLAQVIWLGFDAVGRPDTPLVRWFEEPPAAGRTGTGRVVVVRVTLRDGQVLLGSLQDPGRPDTLTLDHRLLGRLDFPFRQVEAIRIVGGGASRPIERGRGDFSAFDALWLSNGDRLEGILQSLDQDSAVLERTSGQQARIPVRALEAVRLAPVPIPVAAASQAAASALLHLRGGERLIGSGLVWDAARAAMKIAYRGQVVAVEGVALAGIEPLAGPRRWLCDLAAAGYEHHPVLAPAMTWQADVTAAGTPIHSDGRPVAHGIGVPTGSSIRYDVPTGCRRLLVWPMLDDSSDRSVECRARVLVDGQVAWRGTVRAGAEPVAVMAGLAGRRQLTLEVESAASGDVLTRFVWAWPVVLP